MWVLNGDCSKIIQDGEPFYGMDGTHYSPNWDKSTVPGMQQIVLTPEPTDSGFRTTGNAIQMIDGVPTRVWFREALPAPTQEELDAIAADLEANKAIRIAMLESELAALRAP